MPCFSQSYLLVCKYLWMKKKTYPSSLSFAKGSIIISLHISAKHWCDRSPQLNPSFRKSKLTFFQKIFWLEQISVSSILLVKLTWSPPEAAQHSIELAQKTDSSYYVPLLWRLSEHNGSAPDEESKRFPSQITFKRISRKQISNPISVWQPWKMRRRLSGIKAPHFLSISPPGFDALISFAISSIR